MGLELEWGVFRLRTRLGRRGVYFLERAAALRRRNDSSARARLTRAAAGSWRALTMSATRWVASSDSSRSAILSFATFSITLFLSTPLPDDFPNGRNAKTLRRT